GGNVVNRVGAFSHHVRRRHDQAARRPLLARSDLSFLPLRDSATAQSAELVSPSFTALDAQNWCALHSFCPTCGAVVLLRAHPDLLLGRRTNDPLSNYPHPERESFVAELYHHHALYPLLRCSLARGVALAPSLRA